MSWKVGEGRKVYHGRSQKASKGGIPFKNKTVDGKVTEGPERSEKVGKGKKKLNWVEKWTISKDG
jgi:hypothetical protein